MRSTDVSLRLSILFRASENLDSGLKSHVSKALLSSKLCKITKTSRTWQKHAFSREVYKAKFKHLIGNPQQAITSTLKETHSYSLHLRRARQHIPRGVLCFDESGVTRLLSYFLGVLSQVLRFLLARLQLWTVLQYVPWEGPQNMFPSDGRRK